MKLVYESIEDVLKPKNINDFEGINKEIVEIFINLKKLGFNTKIRSNYINPKIKEITSGIYTLSYLPEEEKNWQGFDDEVNDWGYGILNDEDGYLVALCNEDKDKAIQIFIDLLKNGIEAEKKYLNYE